MGLTSVMCLVIEQVRQNITSLLLEGLAGCRRVSQQSATGCLIRRADVAQDALVLVGTRCGQEEAIFVNDGIEAVRMFTLAG
jgi:hypothetical protein